MTVYSLNITVYEGGSVYEPANYSGQELNALVEAIEDLWSPTHHSMRHFDVLIQDEDDEANWFRSTLSLVFKDAETNECIPIPATWLNKKITAGRKRDLSLVGDRIPLLPRQFGLNPWPDSVEVKFTPE